MEFDSSDKALIWNTIGAKQRVKTGLLDQVVEDDIESIIEAIEAGAISGPKTCENRTSRFLPLLIKRD